MSQITHRFNKNNGLANKNVGDTLRSIPLEMSQQVENQAFLNEECPICLEEIGSDRYAILERCLHKYHEKCLREWFQISGGQKCPECNMVNQTRIVIQPSEMTIAKFRYPRKIKKEKYQKIPSLSPLPPPTRLTHTNTPNTNESNNIREMNASSDNPDNPDKELSNTCWCVIS